MARSVPRRQISSASRFRSSQPFSIGPAAFKTIPNTNDMYAAMSEAEFFATCYAEYFRDPTGIKNHANWGGNLNGSAKAFFSEVMSSGRSSSVTSTFVDMYSRWFVAGSFN